jgi:hypothetical protein
LHEFIGLGSIKIISNSAFITEWENLLAGILRLINFWAFMVLSGVLWLMFKKFREARANSSASK